MVDISITPNYFDPGVLLNMATQKVTQLIDRAVVERVMQNQPGVPVERPATAAEYGGVISDTGGAIKDAAMTAGTAINQGAGKVMDAVSSFAQAKAPEGGTKIDVDPEDEGPRRGVIWPAAFLPEVRKQANLGNDPIDLRRMSTANLDALKDALHPAMRKTWEDERQRRGAVRQMTGRLLEMGKTDAANKMLADAQASAWAEDPSSWARQAIPPQKDEIQVGGSDVTIR